MIKAYVRHIVRYREPHRGHGAKQRVVGVRLCFQLQDLASNNGCLGKNVSQQNNLFLISLRQYIKHSKFFQAQLSTTQTSTSTWVEFSIAKLSSAPTSTSTWVENSINFVLVHPPTHHPPGLVVKICFIKLSFNFSFNFNSNFSLKMALH